MKKETKRQIWLYTGMICVLCLVVCLVAMGTLRWINPNLTQVQALQKFWYLTAAMIISAVTIMVARERIK